ncbi:MAG: hypothetical protein WBG24_04465, partial [Syntrophobacteria bacterium]
TRRPGKANFGHQSTATAPLPGRVSLQAVNTFGLPQRNYKPSGPDLSGRRSAFNYQVFENMNRRISK